LLIEEKEVAKRVPIKEAPFRPKAKSQGFDEGPAPGLALAFVPEKCAIQVWKGLRRGEEEE